MYICAYMGIYVCTCICKYVHICEDIYVYVCLYVNICVYMYVYIYLGSQGRVSGEQHGESPNPSAGSSAPSRLGRRFGFRSRMIVLSFGLEEYGVVGVTPEVGYRIAAVTATRQNLQSARALSVRTGFSLLFLSRLGHTVRKCR